MCGIAGIVHFNSQLADQEQVRVLLQQIRHRGPDGEGFFMHGQVGLGHARLSILDLSTAGHQPMKSKDERYCMIFNGGIYNYLELKAELAPFHHFTSTSDSEVLLAAYQQWGEDCLHRFNGDFAFVIYDVQEDTLFGARDRFGAKPFYYRLSDTRFAFASEIKALLPLEENPEANDKAIFDYIVYNRTDHTEATFFKHILKLKHGHSFTLKKGKLNIRRWYDLESKLHYPTPLRPEEFRDRLRDSIRLRLRSDVPVGVCLSGGIDSSSITSVLLHDFNRTGLNTFSAVFDGDASIDERMYMNAYRDQLSNMHFVSPTAESFYSEFTEFIISLSEPIPGPSPYAQFKVMQLAQGKVTVTMDGQGADEMLGGYTYFYGAYFKELLMRGKLPLLIREALAYYRKNASKEAYSYFIYYGLPHLLKDYIGRHNGSVSEAFYKTHYRESTISEDLYHPPSLHRFFLQHFEYKLEHLLKWDDLNSMKFSIESRIPFLDHRLVESSLSLPPELLLHGGVSKFILRESVKDILPAAIYNRRDKVGFAAPGAQWLKSPSFAVFIRKLLQSPEFAGRGYFDAVACRKKYEMHVQGKADYSKDIWKWVNLEMWFRHFIDKKKSD